MAGNIKGITVDIGGNTGPLDKALQGVNKTSRDLQNELKQVEKLLKLDPTNTELLAQKQKLLADSVENAKSKLDKLKEAERQVQQQFKEGKISEQQYRALEREIVSSEQNLKSLEKQSKKTNDTLSDKKPVEGLKNLAKAAAAAAIAVGAAFAKMAGAALENADELQRQADVTGLTAERLQELEYAGKNLGVELDTITGAQAKLTKSMEAAKDGTGAQAEAFRALGIHVTDNNGRLKDAKDIMSEAFTALNKMGNETERDALSMQIFGKSAMELNPIIKAGGDELNRLTKEARENGAVMSDKAVAGLDAFGDTLDNIKSSIMGSFGEALGQLIPKIQEQISKIDLKKLTEGIKVFAEKAIELLSFLIKHGNAIIGIVGAIGVGLMTWNIVKTITDVVKGVKGVIGIFKEMNPETLKTTAIVVGVTAALIALAAIIAVIIGKSGELNRTMASIGGTVGNMASTVNGAGSRIGRNALGTSNWQGGLTWVGEQGPELINLPDGTRIYNNQQSKAIADSGRGGDTIINLNVKMDEVDEVYKLVNVAKRARQTLRAGRVAIP